MRGSGWETGKEILFMDRMQTKYKDEVASVINGLFGTITGRKEVLTLENDSEFVDSWQKQ